MKKESAQEDLTPRGAVWGALEVVAALWAIGLMGYFYYSKEYLVIVRQIWGMFFG
jgi:hypothetical protein